MKNAFLASCIALGMALIVAGCGSQQPADNAAPAPAAALETPTLEELRAASYAGLEDLPARVTLTDGRWEGEPIAPGAASRSSVSLAPGFLITGDLDGDSPDEAVVMLAQSSGGSGTINYLAIVSRTADGVRNVATTQLGDRVDIRAARIENRRLLVSVVRAGEGDALCCPGELAELGWTLSGTTLHPVDTGGVATRLTLDALAGTEWVLKAWNIGEAAPNQPEVTLVYQDGRLSGTSGCNRYTATPTVGDMPGDLTVGPVAGTRMACPEPQSAVEARFLAQLEGTRKFGFLLGQLSITYERDGNFGLMLFDGRPPTGAARSGPAAAGTSSSRPRPRA